MKIVVAGASGFLGRALIASLKDHEVVAFVRHNASVPGARAVVWDGLKMGAWAGEIDGADVVVNYAGSPVTVKLNDGNRKLILETRVRPTYLIGQAIGGASRPPRVWINGSAVGYYGSRGAEILDESSSAGKDFLAEVCVAWEEALKQESLPDTRRVTLRTGIVLGRNGGALKPLLTLSKLFLGGPQGDGNQWQPWIHLDDHASIVRFLIDHDIAGPVNACGPAPCPNSTFMAALRKVLHRPFGLPAPKPLISLVGKIAGPDPEVALASQRVLPKVLQEAGFRWTHPTLEEALKDLVAS